MRQRKGPGGLWRASLTTVLYKVFVCFYALKTTPTWARERERALAGNPASGNRLHYNADRKCGMVKRQTPVKSVQPITVS